MLTRHLVLAAALQLLAAPVLAQSDLRGNWILRLEPADSASIIGMLQLERGDEGWIGFVEGGPVEVIVDGDELEVLVDSRNLQGFVFNRRLTGKLDDGRLSGTFVVEGETKPLPPDGSWSGMRKSPDRPRADPDPVDISGIWTPAQGIDFRKYSMALTPEAQKWLDGYMFHYDQPNVRCVSPGIVAMVAWGGYPMEILKTDQRFTILYEVENSVRRIFMDGRPPTSTCRPPRWASPTATGTGRHWS